MGLPAEVKKLIELIFGEVLHGLQMRVSLVSTEVNKSPGGSKPPGDYAFQKTTETPNPLYIITSNQQFNTRSAAFVMLPPIFKVVIAFSPKPPTPTPPSPQKPGSSAFRKR